MSRMSTEKKIGLLFLLAACIVMIALSAFAMSKKERGFVDEYFSMSCANSETGKTIPIEEGVPYNNLQEIFVKQHSADAGSAFDLSRIWTDSNSVHPPLYYVVLHLVSSIVPGVMSWWFGYAVNAVSGIVMLVFAWKILHELVDSEVRIGMITLGIALTGGLTSNLIFIRMYAMTMAMLTLFTWLLLRIFRRKFSWGQMIALVFVSLACALTHYYNLFYLAFGSLCLGILLLIHKRWKDFGFFCAAQAAAGGLCLLIFPKILKALFDSSRGKQAAETLAKNNISTYLKNVLSWFSNNNRSYFGEKLWILIALMAVLLIVALILRKCRPSVSAMQFPADLSATHVQSKRICLESYLLLFVPVILNILVIVKVSPYHGTLGQRYVYPVMPLFCLCVFVPLTWILSMLPARRWMTLVLACCCLGTAGLSRSYSQNYITLYEGNREETRALMSPYQGTDAFFWSASLNNTFIDLQPYFQYFGSLTYYSTSESGSKNLRENEVFQSGKDALVYVELDHTENIDKLLKELPGYTAEFFYEDTRFQGYYLHKENGSTAQ